MSTAKKFGIKELASGRKDSFRLPLGSIHIKAGWNARDVDTDAYRSGIRDLALSIAAVGVKEPLTGYMEDGQFFLSNGHRRIDAINLANLEMLDADHQITDVLVNPEPASSDDADRILSMIVRNSGVPFTPMENARVFKRQVDSGLTVQDIAKKCGLTDTRIRQTLELLSLPETIQTHVAEGRISAETAKEVVARVGTGEADKVVRKGLEVAAERGRKKTTKKDMASDLVGDKPPRKVIGSARTAPFEDGPAPDELYNKLKVEKEMGGKLAALADRLREVLSECEISRAEGTEYVSAEIPRDLYDAMRDALGMPSKC